MAVLATNCIIQINELRRNAMLAQGKTVANSWAFTGKTNIVVGENPGNLGVYLSCANLLNDSDVTDLFIPNQGAASPTVGSVAELV